MAAASSSARGLGRGLGALLPDAPPTVEVPLVEQALGLIIDQAFAAVSAVSDPTLFAYLQSGPQQSGAAAEPQLVLRRPTLHSLSSSEAFSLFRRIGQLAQLTRASGTFGHAGTRGMFLRTAGPDSHGLFVIGLADDQQDAEHYDEIAAALAPYEQACHHTALTSRDDLPPLRLTMTHDGDVVTATVGYPAVGSGDDVVGVASGHDLADVALRAVLNTTDRKWSDHIHGRVLDDAASLVTLVAADGTSSVGFALGESGPECLASAALRAVLSDASR